MPTLKQLTCHVERGPTDSALHEYATSYGDGVVTTYLSVPVKPTPFKIHLTSHGFIGPGLAMFVFIDGKPQCNRNRRNLVVPSDISERQHTEVDFQVNQKESKTPSGKYLARPWRFEKLNTVDADSVPALSEHVKWNTGNIEVVVLRCHGQIEKAKTPSPPDKRKIKPAPASSSKDPTKGDLEAENAYQLPDRRKKKGVRFALAPDSKAKPDAVNSASSKDPPLQQANLSVPRRRGFSGLNLCGPLFDGAADQELSIGTERRSETEKHSGVHPHSDPDDELDMHSLFATFGQFDGTSDPPPQGFVFNQYVSGDQGHGVTNASYGHTHYPPPPPPQQNPPWLAPYPGLAPMPHYHHPVSGPPWYPPMPAYHAPYPHPAYPYQAYGHPQPQPAYYSHNHHPVGGQEVHGGNNGNGTDLQQGNDWGKKSNGSNEGAKSNDSKHGDDAETGNSGWGNTGNDNNNNTAGNDQGTAAADKTWGSAKTEQNGEAQASNDNWGNNDADQGANNWGNNDADRGAANPDTTSNADKNSSTRPNTSKQRSNNSSIHDRATNTDNMYPSVDPKRPFIKPYFASWQPLARAPSTKSQKRASIIDRAYTHTEEPPLAIPNAAAEQAHLSHAMQPGKGTYYSHATLQPLYIDSMDRPYAVFCFKYRSSGKLSEILGEDVAGLEEKIERGSYKDRMMGLSKEEILDELQRSKKALGYGTDSSLDDDLSEKDETEGANDGNEEASKKAKESEEAGKKTKASEDASAAKAKGQNSSASKAPKW